MNREDVLRTPDYWRSIIEVELYKLFLDQLKTVGLTKKDFDKLSKKTGLHFSTENMTMSQMVNFVLSCGYAPILTFEPLEEHIRMDAHREDPTS